MINGHDEMMAALLRHMSQAMSEAADKIEKGIVAKVSTPMPAVAPKAMENNLTMTLDEAAKFLGISRATAYKMARDNRLPAIRLTNRNVLVNRKALVDMLKPQTAV